MGDKTPQKTETQSQTGPWAPTQGLLTNIIGKYSGMNTDVSPEQKAALDNLVQSTGTLPNFGNAGAGALTNLFNSNTGPSKDILNTGYDALNRRIGGTADGNDLNPYNTPGFSDALGTLTSDITKSVKDVYNGSGRAPSGAGSFAGSLGRGLMQGEAPIIQSQFNTNNTNRMGAAKSLFDASGGTATGLNALTQAQLQNGVTGLQGAGMLGSLFASPGQTALQAANLKQNTPFTNLSPMLQAGTALGGLGGQQSGTSTMTPANNPLANWIGGGSALAGLMFSDADLKTDIAPVGELDDGQTVFSYKYKGSDTPQLGLIAQHVLEHEPEAVYNVGGKLAVDYGKATERARHLRSIKVGMLEAA